MSALSYYSTKSRVGARTERIRTEIDRSSAYILDSGKISSTTGPSGTSSYSTLGRQGSFRETGRPRVRDSSLDVTSRTSRRSSSIDYSAPVKMRQRDLSVDYSSSYSKPTYSSGTRVGRPATANCEEEHSAEYKKILEKTDIDLTLIKYSKKDSEMLKVDGMIEENGRSKAYKRIMGESTALDLERDAYKSTMLDIFADTKGFSAKTMNAINKEVLYKEDKGPKNYGWRKEMNSYEENLEMMDAHKRSVREATRATRDVDFQPTGRFRSVDAKSRDYERECRRDVDKDPSPVKKVTMTLTPTQDKKNTYNTYKATEPASSYTGGTSSYSSGSSSYSNGTTKTSYDTEETTNSTPKKGSWRKEIEIFEEKITKPKPTSVINRNVETKEEEPKAYSWQKSAASTASSISTSTSTASSTASRNPARTDEVKTAPLSGKKEDPKAAETQRWKKTETTKIEETQPVEVPKPTPAWKKPETPNVEETTKPLPKPAEAKKEEPQPETPKATATWKKPDAAKVEEPKPVEAPKPTPAWKKPAGTKVEEKKPEEPPKPAPKPVEAKKEEPKPETPKATPKWKKPEGAKPVEVKPAESPKPAPKWKKAEPVKKEEPKPVEEPKPAPKWGKPAVAKKEEAKPVEEEKPAPKWGKPPAAKKEEPKPVEEAKPTPKWKKPETAKKEETKPAEPEKPVPKWKKPPAAPEPVPDPEPEPVVEEVKPVVENDSRLKPEPEQSTEESKAEEKKEGDGEKKEEEEEEDHHGMKAMAKEQSSKFSAMDEEFVAGASKLSALRAKMKALRMKHKAAAEADAAADAAAEASRKG